MTVAAILKHKGAQVTRVAPDDTIERIAATLAEHRIGAVPVVEGDDVLVGIVSERDIVRALAEHGAPALAMTAARVMTSSPQVITLATTVTQAMEMMTNGRFRHLPVVAGGKMVGLISIGDVVKARITAQETEVASLTAYVAGAA